MGVTMDPKMGIVVQQLVEAESAGVLFTHNPATGADERLIEVRGAVQPGDAVVTEGAFLLKTELSPESIGAGCCEVEPPGGS